VDDLHNAIRQYLARHNARLRRPARIEQVRAGALRSLAACRRCDAPIVAGDDAPALAALLAARRCLDCYLREAA
jgi:hypothetical protein